MKWFIGLVGVGLMLGTALYAQKVSPSESELKDAGMRIFMNETGGKNIFLVHWNHGEEFPSLGIGHFIWYPKDYAGSYDESFPGLVRFYLAHGYEKSDLPTLMTATAYAPWATQSALLEDREAGEGEIMALIHFLEETKEVQIAYIFARLEGALETMLATSQHPAHVKAQFYRVANSTGGFYALIDYVNFKGEGVKESERYKGMGWGLLQVLEGMQGTQTGSQALNDFANSAMKVLSTRIVNAPMERGEERWRAGWLKRVETYPS
jgi:hypothetical protein